MRSSSYSRDSFTRYRSSGMHIDSVKARNNFSRERTFLATTSNLSFFSKVCSSATFLKRDWRVGVTSLVKNLRILFWWSDKTFVTSFPYKTLFTRWLIKRSHNISHFSSAKPFLFFPSLIFCNISSKLNVLYWARVRKFAEIYKSVSDEYSNAIGTKTSKQRDTCLSSRACLKRAGAVAI